MEKMLLFLSGLRESSNEITPLHDLNARQSLARFGNAAPLGGVSSEAADRQGQGCSDFEARVPG